jgi:prepilin-type N-terminal cleavage/methylation domain-containing protein
MRAFTLVELMVVVAIIGILAALGSARYEKVTCKAHRTEAYAAMSAVAALEESHRAERDRYVTFASTCPTGSTTCFVYAGTGKTAKFNIAAEVTSTGYLITATGKTSTSLSGAIWRMDQGRMITDVTGKCR